jgi:hypothetical protein
MEETKDELISTLDCRDSLSVVGKIGVAFCSKNFIFITCSLII